MNLRPVPTYTPPADRPPTAIETKALARHLFREAVDCTLAKRCVHGHAGDECFYAVDEVTC